MIETGIGIAQTWELGFPRGSEIYNCTFKNTNKIFIFDIIIIIVIIKFYYYYYYYYYYPYTTMYFRPGVCRTDLSLMTLNMNLL